MPLYEYRCRDCGKQVEVLQNLGDPPLAACRACQSASIEKLVSRSAFQFKGSGWYVTDYAGKQSKADGKDAKDGSSKDAKDGKSTDAAADKPATTEQGKADKTDRATSSTAASVGSTTSATPTKTSTT